MYAAGMIHSRCLVTATVVGLSGVSRSAFSRQNPGASSSGPRALESCPPPTIRFPYAAPFEFCLR